MTETILIFSTPVQGLIVFYIYTDILMITAVHTLYLRTGTVMKTGVIQDLTSINKSDLRKISNPKFGLSLVKFYYFSVCVVFALELIFP